MKYIIDLSYNFFNNLYRLIKKNDFNKDIYTQFVKHIAVGGFGILLNYTLFNVFIKFNFGILLSNTLTNIFVFLIIFLLQKYFTYRIYSEIIKHLLFFLINALGYYILDTGLLFLLIQFVGLNPMLGKLLSLIIITPISFLSQKYLVFK